MSDLTKCLTSTFVKPARSLCRDSHSSPDGELCACGASLMPRFTFFLQTGSYVHLGARAAPRCIETTRAVALPSRQLTFACPSYSPPTSNPNSAAAGSGGVGATLTIACRRSRDRAAAPRVVTAAPPAGPCRRRSTPRRSSSRPTPRAGLLARAACAGLRTVARAPVLVTPPRLSAVRPAPLHPPSSARARPPRPPVLARLRAPPTVAARLDPRPTLADRAPRRRAPGRLVAARDQRRRVRLPAAAARAARGAARPPPRRRAARPRPPDDVPPAHATTHARGRRRGRPVRPALLPSAAAWPPKHPSTT